MHAWLVTGKRLGRVEGWNRKKVWHWKRLGRGKRLGRVEGWKQGGTLAVGKVGEGKKRLERDRNWKTGRRFGSGKGWGCME